MGITLFFKEFGEYLILMKEAFKRPQNIRVFRRKIIFEMQVLGVDSVPIVFVISIFIGAAVVMQMLVNLNNPIYPSWVFGYASKKSIILEFSPTVISLILAGKCASRIASEIGTQRISEQIDALEVMGVNTPSYLILPKIIACLIFFPLLTIISIFTGLFGGALGAILEGSLSIFHYVEGIRLEFTTVDIVYALTKSAVFALIVSSIACYRGYTIKGGSVEVGQQSTKAVVQSCMVIMIFNLLITSLFN